MTKPLSIFNKDDKLVAPPQGVKYAGCRAEGAYLVLRFLEVVFHEDGDFFYQTYCDRYFNSDGVELWRENGNVMTPIGFWKRLWKRLGI